MAEYDVINDPTPQNKFKKPSAPTVAALKSALTTFSATSYTPARLQTMNENDLIFACRSHGLTVVGL